MDRDSDQTKRLLCEFGYSYELEVYPDPGMSLQGNSVELKNFVRNCYLLSSIPSFLKLLRSLEGSRSSTEYDRNPNSDPARKFSNEMDPDSDARELEFESITLLDYNLP